MKKNMISKMIAVATVALPLVTFAQDTKVAQKTEEEKFSYGAPSYWRPYSQNAIGVFETTKEDANKPYEGKKIRFGAGFTMQYQSIKHSNEPTVLDNSNRLWKLTPGFMTAQANLFIDAQLADGISMNVTNYMSARHHNEFWVKGGYIQIDKLPMIKSKLLDEVMKLTTIKVGHMEVNYGDAHFRRPDGGNTMQAPFMEGNIMDAFATEIGGEVLVRKSGFFGMIGVSNGMIKGHVDSTFETKVGSTVIDDNTKRNPSFYFKGGWDKQVNNNVRVRLSGSLYTNSSQAGSGLTLYSGDRSGSNYQNVMEVEKKADGTVKAYTDMYSSGRFNPGFSKQITAFMLNSFVKAYGFEFFGTYEQAKGRAKTEVDQRNAKQYAVEGIYRFGKNESFYLGARFNKVDAELMQTPTLLPELTNVSIDRTALAAGWFITKNVLMKAEYVTQKYNNFQGKDFRKDAKFDGVVIEAVLGF